ncbi:MAG: Wzz/FepE/Etk N-terminal domain-containing protein [Clostridia bacterium]|nr:Wzz/FepE/Etk N-terminal domain-containing protein [Clostridia bacterium]
MEIKKYLNMVSRRLWIIVLLPFIASSITGYISFKVLKPAYESDISLYVVNKRPDPQLPIQYDDIMASQQLVKDYRELIKSRTVTREVIKELNLENLTPESLAEKITISLKNDTRIIEIKVLDGDPDRAQKLANKLGEAFINKIAGLTKVDNVSIVDMAEKPEKPVKPRPIVNIVISFFTGLIAALGVVFVMEYMNDTIRSAEDVENQLGLTVLGTIPVLSMK